MKRLLTAILILLSILTANSQGGENYGALILYDRCYVKFYPDGRKVWREEKAVKITGKRGIKDFGEIVIPFSTEHQKLKILYAYTITPDGKVIKPEKKAFNVVYPPFVSEAPIYSDLKYQTISMPAVTKGAVIKYAYELKTVKPYMKGQFWETDFMQDEYPIEETSFTAEVPKNRFFKYKTYNFHQKPREKDRGKFIELRWELKDVPPIESEPNMPPFEELAKRISITSLKSWNDVARWYSELSKEAIKPDKLVREVTLQVIRGKKSKEEKIRAIYNFVSQNIRYVGMEFGINGYKPHKASEVLKNRYGDCKDHATLLIAMLKVIGVKGYPVLIPTMSRANMDPEMPMPTAFNHEIAAIRWNGKWLFMDTTSDFVPFGLLPPGDQGRRVLIVDVEREKGLVTETPVFPPKENVEGFEGKFQLKPFGRLDGNFKFIYTGVYAIFEKARLINSTKEQIRRYVEALAAKVSPGFNVEEFKLSDYKNPNKDKVWIEIEGYDENYGTMTSHYLLAKFPAPDYSRLISLVAPKKRKYPYVVGYKMMKESEVELSIPKGYSLYLKPENFEFKNRVGEFSIKWRVEKEKIGMVSKLVLKKRIIPPKEYGDLRELFNTAVKTLRNQIVVLKRE
ncbi:MAG: transglutaminase [Thermovibrio sp.]|nr:MAG: transglutaminase [Thermovibrio sp.]